MNEAAFTVKNISSVYVKEMDAEVKDNQVVSYGINAKVSIKIDHYYQM